ncbi:hypothetical protein RHGRI_008046 [Rhododendron griersonianum]|uniref:O-fucosyltransferase family protein n=1 Tax=Rhododendron griersonianum TaxID=479676 RepID=A0AAV6KZ68_9ERIC|nr:hypothetical protein RHGRI_008046 [Rhododendron griersonianum]
MEALNFNRSNIRWKKRPYPRSPSSLLPISLLFLLFSFLLFLSYKHISTSTPTNPPPSRFCNSQKTLAGEKFLWYAPHSGFSNQLSEFRNAVLMAAILNRTLIVPPVLDHHAVALGSCPKFRVLNPTELRFSVWNHVHQVLPEIGYVSMADIIDLSKLVSGSDIRVIDFSVFISIWCGVHIDLACSTESNRQSSSLETVRECGSLLSGNNGNVNSCVHVVDEDCRTTVWTYGKDSEDGILDSFQPDEELKKKKKISYIRTRRDVYKTLGPGSGSEPPTILAFGSLFTSPYKGSELHIDIHESPKDQRMQSLIEKVRFLPFVPEITNAGKEFVNEKIKSPFLCAQLRLLDGQFKNHWKGTFLGLKQKIEYLRHEGGPLQIHIFVMTDLPGGNWTGSYLEELANSDSLKLHVLRENDEIVITTAKKLGDAGMKKHCRPPLLPDLLLYIEETSIELMRKYGVCSIGSVAFYCNWGSLGMISDESVYVHMTCSKRVTVGGEAYFQG